MNIPSIEEFIPIFNEKGLSGVMEVAIEAIVGIPTTTSSQK